jgi:hypothetical protein
MTDGDELSRTRGEDRIVSRRDHHRRGQSERTVRGSGHEIGPSMAETFQTEFLRKLRRRRGVKLVISNAQEGMKAAVAKLDERHLAALPSSYDARCAGPCRQERPPCRLHLHRNRLRPG